MIMFVSKQMHYLTWSLSKPAVKQFLLGWLMFGVLLCLSWVCFWWQSTLATLLIMSALWEWWTGLADRASGPSAVCLFPFGNGEFFAQFHFNAARRVASSMATIGDFGYENGACCCILSGWKCSKRLPQLWVAGASCNHSICSSKVLCARFVT